MRATRQFLISGRVQGVGYRWFAMDAASREGLVGHVRNLPDGRVEVVAEGDVDGLTRFEAALRRGPSRSRVEHLQIAEIEPLGGGDGFRISG
ncbi:MAG: acylphosphatase [Vicinamibacterales bacterium]